MRSATGYVGLKNFGCTCYMNALLQQLFMMQDFRKGILLADVNSLDQDSSDLYQMKQIFANLQESEKQYYSPQGFINAFKWYGGESINVRQQQDTHEFYNLLYDNLERELRSSNVESLQNLMRSCLGGSICYETKSLEEKEYPFVSEREEPFVAIPLDIKNKKTI